MKNYPWMPRVNMTIITSLLLSHTIAWFNFRNQSNSADTHQRVLLHAEIMIPLSGKVGTKQTFFFINSYLLVPSDHNDHKRRNKLSHH